MISNQSFTNVQPTGKYSLYVVLTKQIKELGIKQGSKVYCCVEEKEGKKRIIVEGVE